MRSRNFATALLIFVATFAIYRCSPNQQVFDSKYTMLFSERLLWHGSPSAPREVFQIPEGAELPYHLMRVGDRIYYYFPPGSTILSAPYVALLNLAGVSATDEDGHYQLASELKMQRRLAPFLTAALVVVIFLIGRLLLPLGWSLIVASASAFGTPLWSSASRAVMADTWGVFLSGLVVWLLVRAETKQKSLRPIWLATLLAWLYFAKPTYCIPISAISVYVLFFHRRIVLPFVLTGSAWLLAFIVWSKYHFGTLLPAYYHASRLTLIDVADAISGTLLSPSRGLFISVPVLWFVGYLLVRYWRWQAWPRLVWLSLAIFLGHWLVLVANIPWGGGHAYGPRLMTGIMPWLVLLAVLGLEARRRARATLENAEKPLRWRAEMTAAGVLLALGIFIHAVGAFSFKALLWNVEPVDVDVKEERLWDWSDPQFLAPFLRR